MALVQSSRRLQIIRDGETCTIFPRQELQTIPDSWLEDRYIQSAIKSGWIVVHAIAAKHAEKAIETAIPTVKRKRGRVS